MLIAHIIPIAARGGESLPCEAMINGNTYISEKRELNQGYYGLKYFLPALGIAILAAILFSNGNFDH